MQADSNKNKQSLLKQINAVLARRVSVGTARQAALFSDVYFKRVPLEEMGRDTPEMLAVMVAGQLEFLQQRKCGELLIRIFNPDKKRDGWDCQHTVVELVNDDMPFLVDTASMVMQELNLGVHLIVHPILNVEREANGKLKSISLRSTKNSLKESFIHIHLDKQTAPALLKNVEAVL